MTQGNYHYAGLRIISELPIPEWTVFEQFESAGDPDVLIRLGNTLTQVSETNQVWITPDEYRFSIPEAGEYRVLRGREILVTPAPNAGATELRLFLLGSAWGALCHQRSILALHTSVVLVGEHAVAFCGATGTGKSSIAARLIARGYPLVGDDLCCFDLSGDVPRVYPSAPRLKLWRDTLTHLGWSEDNLVRDHFRLDKFHLVDLPGFRKFGISEPLPLGAIYLLEWGDLRLTRLTGLNALRRLIASATYRAELIEPLGQTGAYWEQCAQLARATPIWELKRPRDWAVMDAALTQLIENWSAKSIDL